jgi:hypothetical protein
VDNSIRLNELQVLSEALRKGDKRFKVFFFFFKRISLSKGFFLGEEGRMR